ncbi:glycosyltransferase family 4 protein [Algoriphagus jejuensis]|uniref:glycosyltransferase family 4 protein n=1 Tax=Algoriphagus jejuensis TaxID=419934 RepID=UPI0031DDCCBC
MRIVQVIQKPQRRGAEIFTVQLSGQMSKQGHEVLLVSVFTGPGGISYSGEWVKMERRLSQRFYDFKAWSLLSKLIESWKPDLIQANAADTLKFTVFSKIFFRWKIPIIYRNANQMGDFIKNGFHRRFNQFLINQVSAVASVSKASKEDIHCSFSFPINRSRVLPIGIETNSVNHLANGDISIQLPESFLLQIGGLVEEKAPLAMLSIFVKLQKKYTWLKLLYVGSGSLESVLRKEIAVQGLDESVSILPSQSNIFPILSKAFALVMPSKIEGLPGVILEAMYCRVPVIAFGVGGIPEVLKNGETGWCIAPGQADDFLAAIEDVISADSKLKSQIFDKAHQLVNNSFNIEKITRQFEGFYNEILFQNSV